MNSTHGPCDTGGRHTPPVPLAEAWPGRPTGLGTNAALVPSLLAAAGPSRQAPYGTLVFEASPLSVRGGPAYAERSWGDGSHSPLYCPLPERVDQSLADEVDARLRSWARDRGFHDDELDALSKAAFGQLVTLAHPDTDDPDALLVAAQLNAAWWAADDYYADDTALGAVPARLPQRLTLVMSAMDPVPPVGDFTPPLRRTHEDDLVLRMLSSAVAHLSRHATGRDEHFAAPVHRTIVGREAMGPTYTQAPAWTTKRLCSSM